MDAGNAISNNNCDHTDDAVDALPTGKETWIDFDGLRRLLILGNAKLIYSASTRSKNSNQLPSSIEHCYSFLKHLYDKHQNECKKIIDVVNETYNRTPSTYVNGVDDENVRRSFITVLALLNNIASADRKKELGIYEGKNGKIFLFPT